MHKRDRFPSHSPNQYSSKGENLMKGSLLSFAIIKMIVENTTA